MKKKREVDGGSINRGIYNTKRNHRLFWIIKIVVVIIN